MSTQPAPTNSIRSLFRNWLSLFGAIIVAGAIFAFLLLFVLDTFAHSANPYVGILTYLVAPMFLVVGLAAIVLGALWRRRQLRRQTGEVPKLQIDFSRARDRRLLGIFIGCSALFLLLSAIGSYNTYHFTESVQFCGQACHTVMEPEMVAYENGSHARVACTECHIGPGATWYVRSKLSGLYQVYATARDLYPRPIPTPIHNLRPSSDTCEQCHWPQKFSGDLDRTYSYYLAEEKNPHHEIRMSMKVGGADPRNGPVGGIHWHMNVANKVEYLATDKVRQKIPYVRVTDPQGVVTEYRSGGFTNTIDPDSLRTVDCMDCHNRPAHRFASPNAAVNLAIKLGQIDANLPWIKTNAVELLVREYRTETEALQTIATTLTAKYANAPRIKDTVTAVQRIYSDNFFPEMKVSWKAYPDNIGHKDWPGCFRCHDDKHKTADGKKKISMDCNACHLILAQGTGKALEQLTPAGQPFKHPADDYEGYLCNDCHSGGL